MVGIRPSASRATRRESSSVPTALVTFPSRTVTSNVPSRDRSPSLDVSVYV